MLQVLNTSVPGNVWPDDIILSYAWCCVKIQRNGIEHILNVPVPSFPNWKATVKKLILRGLIWCLVLVICLLCHPLSCWSSHHIVKYCIQCTGGVHDLPFNWLLSVTVSVKILSDYESHYHIFIEMTFFAVKNGLAKCKFHCRMEYTYSLSLCRA